MKFWRLQSNIKAFDDTQLKLQTMSDANRIFEKKETDLHKTLDFLSPV